MENKTSNDFYKSLQKYLRDLSDFNKESLTVAKNKVIKLKENKIFRPFKDQLNKITQLNKEIATAKARQNFINDLTAQGYENEISEIWESVDEIMVGLFGETDPNRSWVSKKWDRIKESHAHQYVQHKANESKIKLNEFIEAYPKLIKRMDNLTDRMGGTFDATKVKVGTIKDLCASSHKVWGYQFAAKNHINAAKNYCQTFDYIIESNDYNAIRKYCFGSNDDLLIEDISEIIPMEELTSTISSVKNIKAHRNIVEQSQAQADTIKDIIKNKLKCN